MKTMLKQMNVTGWLAGWMSSLVLLGCGGGGDSSQISPPRFTVSQDNGLPVVYDRNTGITWAGKLGSDGLPSTATTPYASELLGVADLPTHEIDDYFPFIDGRVIAARERPQSNSDYTWAVDFGQAEIGDFGTLNLQVVTTNPDYQKWLIVKRDKPFVQMSTFDLNEFDGTVVSDNLMWKLCSEGSAFNVYTKKCAPAATQIELGTQMNDMLNAANSGRGYANYKGWRLPTKQELRLLLNLDGVNIDASDATLLPSQFSGDSHVDSILNYWTSSSSADGTKRWQVDFSRGADGGVGLFELTDKAYVRLVRTVN